MAGLLEMAETQLRPETWPSPQALWLAEHANLHLVIETSLQEVGHCRGKPSGICLPVGVWNPCNRNLGEAILRDVGHAGLPTTLQSSRPPHPNLALW